MEREIRKNWTIIFFLLFVVCFLIITFFYLFSKERETFDFKTVTSLTETKNGYKMETEHPLFKRSKLNNAIDILIERKTNYLFDNEKFKLGKMSYSHTIYKNIYSFHFKTLFIKGDTIVDRDDDIKYYNASSIEELEFNDLVKTDDQFYKIIKQLIINYSKSNATFKYNEELTNEEMEKLVFSEDCAYLISVYNNKEYMIPVDYGYLKKYLNERYFEITESKDLKIEEPVKKVEEPKKEEVKKETPKKEVKKEATKKTVKKATPKTELKSSNDGSINKYIPKVRDASYFAGKKLICFTYDDGPAGKYTQRLLDGLKARNAKVTFFMVGNRVKKNASLVRRMKDEGHSIGQHSYSHANLKKLSTTDPNKAKNEIYLANDAIKSIIGSNPLYIRPPYGAYNSTVLSYADMVFVNWSIDPLDWKYRNADTVYKNIISKAYDGAIVLVHDIHPTSVDGSLRAIDYLMKNGYAIVSLDEMAQIRGLNLQTHHLYNSFRKK